jgi:hypothetical protein
MKGTRKPCEKCGVDCYWDAYDLTWLHMGWSSDKFKDVGPHQPVIE